MTIRHTIRDTYRTLTNTIAGVVIACASVGGVLVTPAGAAQISNRSVLIGSSVGGATTSYKFTFTVPSATAVKSADFIACTTAGGTCTTPAGFSASSSSLASQPANLGAATGWSVNTASSGALRITNPSNATAPSGSQTVIFNGVTNPSAVNATFYIRITTYSGASWSGAIDTGTVATSTAGQVQVTASVDEVLTFTLANSTVSLGTLTTSTTGTGSTSFSVQTNATSGYNVTYSGGALTSGSNAITPLASPTASSVGSRQFGMNLVANTSPSVGSNVSGGGSGTVASDYNTPNSFKFASGDIIAASASPTNNNTFTSSYIANIDGMTAPGVYSTSLTYVATTNF